MEMEQSQMAGRILDLTLEIIYLLTGEDDIVVKKTSGDGQNSIMVPLHSLLIPGRNNEQKILEVTKKMIELLTGESENWSYFGVRVKEEIKEEEEEVSVMKEWRCSEGHKDVVMENEPPLTSPDGSSKRNPPEKCPCPLYSRDSTQEHQEIPHHDQGEKVFTMKTEVNVEEETHVRENQLSMKEAEMMVTITKEESSLDIRTGGHKGCNTPEGHLPLSTDYNKEDNGMAQYFPEANTVTQNIHHKLNPTVKSTDQQIGLILWHPNINHMPLSQMSNQALIVRLSPSNAEETSPRDSHPFQDCEKCLGKKHDLVDHKRIHTREKPFSCPECKKSFMNKTDLVRHQRVHTGEKPFSCPECGKCFSDKGNRDKHMRIHTGEKPFSCPECGKRFAQKVTLTIHQKIHARRLLYREYTPPKPT